jgi:hypothetical protein
MVEQGDAAPEQDVYQVHVYLIEQPSFDAVLYDARSTHADILVARDRLRLLQGAFESVRHKREGRSFVDPVLWNRSGDNKDRYVQGVFATPPMVRSNVLRPKTNAPVVLRVSARYSAVPAETMKTMSVPGSLYSVSPSGVPRQELLAADTHGGFRAIVRAGDETIERDRESPVRTIPMFPPSSRGSL